MLVLTRRIDESLVIGENIIITVLAVEGDKVKIGVTAPREVPVLRQELWVAVNEQNQLAERLAAGPEPASFESLRKLLAEESPADTPGNTK